MSKCIVLWDIPHKYETGSICTINIWVISSRMERKCFVRFFHPTRQFPMRSTGVMSGGSRHILVETVTDDMIVIFSGSYLLYSFSDVDEILGVWIVFHVKPDWQDLPGEMRFCKGWNWFHWLHLDSVLQREEKYGKIIRGTAGGSFLDDHAKNCWQGGIAMIL